MATKLDCQGLSCPQPLLRCKKILEEEQPDQLKVLVDNEAACQNVCRFLESRNWCVQRRDTDKGLWTIVASNSSNSKNIAQDSPHTQDQATSCPACGHQILLFLTTDTLGSASQRLGAKLMENYLGTLPELGKALWRIVLVNGAVRLATAQSPCATSLEALEKSGVSILVCGTCLEHFSLTKEVITGQVTNMLDIITSQQVADKIISL